MRRSTILLTIVLTLGVVLVPAMWAQENATITGTILDSTGAVVPDAEVSLTNPATGQVRRVNSGSSGTYLFADAGVGHFTLRVTAAGFQQFIRTDIVVNVDQSLKEDVTLTVGGQGQTVTVQADALQVQSETNEISTLITGKQVTQLATNGRNVTALAILGMGVSNNLPDFNGVNALTAGTGISFNGTRPNHNIYMLDGGELNDRGCGGCFALLPSLDALAEFQTLDSNYGPDYGIGSGGTTLMVLKSGTHDFHGGLWYFNRNEDYDANNYFVNEAGQGRPEFRLNLYGGNLGGPLFIPHLYNNSRTKTFFFVNEEWRKLIIGSTPSVTNTIASNNFPVMGESLTYTIPTNGTVPIVPATGDPGKQALYGQYALTPGQPFPNNTIPAALIDPNAVLQLNAGTFPHPNLAGTSQYISSISQPTDVREDLVRIDHAINSKLQLMGHYMHDAVSQTYYPALWSDSSYPTVGTALLNPAWSSVIKLTQTISPTLLNETIFNYDGNKINLGPLGVYAQPEGWTAQSFFPAANNAGSRMPEIDLGAPYGTNWSANYVPWKNAAEDYQVRDDLSLTKGKHQLKFGFSYMRYTKNQQLQAETQGTYVFSPTAFSNDSYINFLLGDASSFTQLNVLYDKHWVNNTYSFYGNDNWRVTSRLTLNLGLRFDGLPRVYERNNQFANFIPGNYNPALAPEFNADGSGSLNPNGPGFMDYQGTPFYLNGISQAGVNGFQRGTVKNYYDTWQPRVGFAYDLSGGGKTVIRGGVGLFFERVAGGDAYNAALNPPFAFQPSATNVYFSDPFTSALNGVSSGTPLFPSALTTLQFNYSPPGTAQFSLGVQHQIAPSVVAVLQYVGTTGWHQNDVRDINTLPLSSPFRQSVANGSYNANLARIHPGYSSIDQQENDTNFNYNALQAGLRMENRHGLTLQLAYTWSHELDEVSNDQLNVSNPFNLRYDYGSGSLDRRNMFNANYIYDFPFFAHGGTTLERVTLGGWQFSGVTIAQSGTPAIITYTNDVLGLGSGWTNRPNLIAGVSYPKKLNSWFDTSAFAAPIPSWAGGPNQGFGNAAKDVVVGPGRLNFNLALFKSFALTPSEGASLQLRFESFNTFNHTQYNGIDTNFTDGNFGQVTSTFDPRVLQLGAKLNF
jgi:hypothetical protein